MLLPGVLAAVGAWWLGAPWVLLLGVLLYGGVFLRGALGVTMLVLAPLVLSVGVPLGSLATAEAAVALVAAFLGTVPLWLRLGRGLPWQGPVLFVLVALLAGGLLSLHPWSITLYRSDVAARTQIALLALLLWTGSLLVRSYSRRNL